MRARYGATTLAIVSMTSAANAADGQSPDSVLKVVQYAIPAIPALTFIGSTDEKITRPITPKDIAGFVTSGIDQSGHVAQGLGAEFGMRQIFMPHLDVDGYRHHYLFANTAVSIGTVKVASDSSSTNLGLGLRMTVFDGSDPMTATPD